MEIRFCPHDGAAIPREPGADDPYLGAVLPGQFQVLEVAGYGAMGTVYRARQLSMERTVAIKIPHRELIASGSVQARFLREARAAALLSHPNIITVHLIGRTDEDIPFLVMEYIEGESLGALCAREGRLGPRHALHLGRQIASALVEAHAHGVVHRDLKPENVLIVGNDRAAQLVKVLDFGIAKILDSAPGLTASGMVFGTPHFISPEQAEGRPADPRSDQYSLGVMLFRMVTGKLPFDGATSREIVLAHVSGPPPRPRVLVPELPVALEELILRALAKNPDRRWRETEAMLAALDAVAVQLDTPPAADVGEPAPVTASAPVEAPRPPTHRGRWALLAALATAGGLGLAVLLIAGRPGLAPVVDAGALPSARPSVDAAAPRPRIKLHDERALASGANSLRLGFLTQPRLGEQVTLRLTIWNMRRIGGAEVTLRMDRGQGRVEPIPVREEDAAYLAEVAFRRPGRYPLCLHIKLPGGEHIKTSTDFTIAPPSGWKGSAYTSRARCNRSAPTRKRDEEEDLPMTVILPDSNKPRAIGPQP